MNLWIVFKFKDCKLQFYEKQMLSSYFSVNPCTPASRWHRLLKQKQKKINNQASKLVPFSASFLPLALVHARNSQVKKNSIISCGTGYPNLCLIPMRVSRASQRYHIDLFNYSQSQQELSKRFLFHFLVTQYLSTSNTKPITSMYLTIHSISKQKLFHVFFFNQSYFFPLLYI